MNRYLTPSLAVLALGAFLPAQEASATSLTTVQPPVLPQAITSFGAARSGDSVYVYGGHIGRAHQHTREHVVGAFWRIAPEAGSQWEALPDGPPLQGTALAAAADGRLFRVGGMTAKNAPGEKGDLHSTASVDVFDPEVGAWQSFVPLPEPRSSHDAIVVGNVLYVAGGWNLSGRGGVDWHATAWACDLGAEEPAWSALPNPPSTRRAAALAQYGDEVILVGGMAEYGTTAEVWIYSLQEKAWRDGPVLPGPAFGAAAVGVADSTIVTASDGRVFRLDAGAADWAFVNTMTLPRFFHRLVPAPGHQGTLLALGGAGHGGHTPSVEFLALDGKQSDLLHQWTLPSPGQATYRAAFMQHGDRLFAFGGNRGTSEERFAPDQLVDEVLAIDLTTMSVDQKGRMPFAAQSMVTASWGSKPGENLVLGGLGVTGDDDAPRTRSLDEAFAFGMRDGTTTPLPTHLPAPRTQFQSVVHDGKVWLFGGIDFTPGDRDAETTYPLSVLVYDPKQPEQGFVDSGIELPGPRRSFGVAKIGSRVHLIGGLGGGFSSAEGDDVVDLDTGEWSRMPAAPKHLISPQVVTIGDTVYVACGGTMDGFRFAEDRSVMSFRTDAGWSTTVTELPFGVRNVQMRAVRDRLLFVDMQEPGEVVLRSFRPEGAPLVLARGFH